MLKLSKASKSAVRCWYSAQTSADPADAASTCTHISGSSCKTCAISSSLSTAQVYVVPSVAVRKKGSSPACRHCHNVCSSAGPVILKSSSILIGTD